MTKKAFAFKTASHIILFPIVVLFFMFCNNINAQDVPTSSYGHTMSLSSSNEIFLYGGWEDGSALPKTNSREGVLGDIFKWDAASSQWTKLTTTNPPQDRVSHAAFFSSASGDDKLYVLYGTDYSAQFTDVWSFNPATNAWTEETITGTSPGSREVLACAATSDGKIIMVGALNSNYDTVNDVWAYDPASNTFEQKNSFPGGSTYANSMARVMAMFIHMVVRLEIVIPTNYGSIIQRPIAGLMLQTLRWLKQMTDLLRQEDLLQ